MGSEDHRAEELERRRVRREERHRKEVQEVMAEWGFKDEASAEAFLRKRFRNDRGKLRQKKEQKYRGASCTPPVARAEEPVVRPPGPLLARPPLESTCGHILSCKRTSGCPGAGGSHDARLAAGASARPCGRIEAVQRKAWANRGRLTESLGESRPSDGKLGRFEAVRQKAWANRCRSTKSLGRD